MRATPDVAGGPPVVERTRTRGYQMEMFQESLKRNIIVAMDTGSGKTHIAVLRIRQQLDKGDGKLCWLLVPSIPLGQQQYEVLRSALPPVNIQFLCGSDNVDKWGDQMIWDRALRLKDPTSTVVISTHQILLDALTHGFVTIDKIGLLIYDEAHHCVGNHPANRIMRDFYHPNFQRLEVPAILGLTASPIVKAKPNQLRIIETNLNAISRSPILNREELLQYVHHPVLRSVVYSPAPSRQEMLAGASRLMPVFNSFRRVYREMDIRDDPHVLQLLATIPPDQKRLVETIENKSTHSHHQMRKIMSKAEHILAEYGVWPTEWYIKTVVQRSVEAAESRADKFVLMGWSEDEKLYLRDTLAMIDLPNDLGAIEGRVTDKVDQLIEALLEQYHGDEGGKDFSGLVFVQQRVGVTILAEIIKTHPRTMNVFNVGTLVGAADNCANPGKLIYELSSTSDQNQTIGGFRTGRKNLVISTSVVEEGLDIPACHLVVCYSLPPNVKSFIQRRGRARRVRSSYFLMIEGGSDMEGKIDKLKKLEQEMIAEYLDETRKLQEILDREDDEADRDGIISDGVNRKFFVQSTGALLTFDSALPHLQHFCGTLPHTEFVDLRPIFTVEAISPDDKEFYDIEKPRYWAEVLLPNSVPPNARRAVSKRAWEKKGLAERDAAFEAYIALYKLEDPLINDNLLPLLQKYPTATDASIIHEKQPLITSVDKTNDPWAEMDWKEDTIVYATSITLKMPNSSDIVEIDILTSVECPRMEKIPIYWTSSDAGEVIVGESRCLGADQTLTTRAKRTTYELLHTVFRARMQDGVMDFPYLFNWTDTSDWCNFDDGNAHNALEAYTSNLQADDLGIIRENSQEQKSYIFRRWRTDVSLSDERIVERYANKPINPDQPVIEAVCMPNRRDFLHKLVTPDAPETIVLLLPEHCTIYKIPWRYSQLALFLPAIINQIGMALIASDLQHTLLAPVGIQSTSNIVAALSAPSARHSTDYQRFEFLGDSVLKFLTSISLLDEHPSWHEGNLTAQKARLISNSNLANVARRTGLANWITTESFTALKWSPRYIVLEDENKDEESKDEESKDDSSTTEKVQPKKLLSKKVLADVVEALIGVAYVEGGYEKALKCIQAFGLQMNWKSIRTRTDSLLAKAASSPTVNIPYLRDLEELIGYKFKHQALLVEAITHPSCESLFPSYQRLEFLGDALLDMVVLDEMFPDPQQLLPTKMHLLKSSVTNGNLLTFLSLGCFIDVENPKVEQVGGDTVVFEVTTETRRVNLWEFVDLSHPEMAKARRKCVELYEGGLRENIQAVLDAGMFYPWTELSGFEAETGGRHKMFADILEAVVGAVFVDSGGDFERVKALAERFGILAVLRRLTRDGVNVTHPLNRLAENVARAHKGTVLYIERIENNEFVCSAWVGGDELAVGRSVCRTEAKVKAAEESLKVLEMK